MKINDIKEKSINELNDIVVDAKKQLFDIRFKKFTNKYENSTEMGRANSEIKELRKTIARAKTIITKKVNEVK